MKTPDDSVRNRRRILPRPNTPRRPRGRPPKKIYDETYDRIKGDLELAILEKNAFSDNAISGDDFSDEDSVRWYMRHASHDVLPSDKINALIAKANNRKNSNKVRVAARNQVVSHNLRLVFSIAKKYASPQGGSLFMDLVQEGSLALIHTIERFDPNHERGAKFSTYAAWWIRQRISNFQGLYSSAVSVKQDVRETLNFVRNVRDAVEQEIGRTATREEIYVALKGKFTRIKAMYFIGLLDNHGVSSLDAQVGEDNDGDHHDLIKDGSIPADEYIGINDDYCSYEDQLRQLVAEVKTVRVGDKSKIAFFMYYGLDGYPEEPTYEAVGKRIGRTRERVRQMVEKIWGKLRKRFSYGKKFPTWQELERKYKTIVAYETITGRACDASQAYHPKKKYTPFKIHRNMAITKKVDGAMSSAKVKVV